MTRLTPKTLESFAQYWADRARALAHIISVSSLPAQRIVQQFHAAGALTPATARPFHPQSRIELLEFQRLLRAGIIRERSPGRYFLADRSVTQIQLDVKS